MWVHLHVPTILKKGTTCDYQFTSLEVQCSKSHVIFDAVHGLFYAKQCQSRKVFSVYLLISKGVVGWCEGAG